MSTYTLEPAIHPAAGLTAQSDRPAVTVQDLRILSSLRKIIQAVDIHSRKLATTCNVTTPQLVALLWIVETGSSTASDIAKQIHLSNSTVVGILDRLESKGLVKRERSTHDRRLVHICATEKGIELARTAPSPLQDVFAKALHKLSQAEQDLIAASLERIVDLMEVREIDAAPLLHVGDVGRTVDSIPPLR